MQYAIQGIVRKDLDSILIGALFTSLHLSIDRKRRGNRAQAGFFLSCREIGGAVHFFAQLCNCELERDSLAVKCQASCLGRAKK